MMRDRMPQTTFSLRLITSIALVLLMLLLAAATYAVWAGDFLLELKAMSSMPWIVVTLLDVYIGFILFSLWVFWREQNTLPAIIIAATVMVLGNIASCLYLLYAVHGADGSMHKLINGHSNGNGNG